MSKFTVKAVDLAAALTAANLATAVRKANTPILECVHLAASGGQLTVTATDRYRLVRGTIKLIERVDAPVTANLTSDTVKAVLALLPRWNTRSGGERLRDAVVTVDGDRITVESFGSVERLTYTGDYPRTDSILDSTKTTAVESIGFTAGFMADLCRMPRDPKTPIELAFRGPILTDWTVGGVEFRHALAPCRIAS